MRFLVLTFLIVGLSIQAVCGGVVSSEESSEESKEKVLTCTKEHEVPGCIMKEKHCGEAPVITKCKHKCICAEGFARTYQGTCVPMDDCSHNKVKRGVTDCSDPNEVYLYCGSACPARCGDAPGSRVCATECIKGCFCKKGFVLNSKNKCVKPEKC